MKFETGQFVNTNMCCLVGTAEASYDRIVEAFGAPTYDEPSGDGKVDIEWNIEFDDGTVATIYNWKDFDGGFRARESSSYTWHIGGRSQTSKLLVAEVLGES
jgi:hypothetical protein